MPTSHFAPIVLGLLHVSVQSWTFSLARSQLLNEPCSQMIPNGKGPELVAVAIAIRALPTSTRSVTTRLLIYWTIQRQERSTSSLVRQCLSPVSHLALFFSLLHLSTPTLPSICYHSICYHHYSSVYLPHLAHQLHSLSALQYHPQLHERAILASSLCLCLHSHHLAGWGSFIRLRLGSSRLHLCLPQPTHRETSSSSTELRTALPWPQHGTSTVPSPRRLLECQTVSHGTGITTTNLRRTAR